MVHFKETAGARINLEMLGLDQGGHLLVNRALGSMASGEGLHIMGTAPDLLMHLRVFARKYGHAFDERTQTIIKGTADHDRWGSAVRVGSVDANAVGGVVDHPLQSWGLAARGSLVELGGADFDFTLLEKNTVWSDDAHFIYRQALSAQWDPETAVDWGQVVDLPPEIEGAVVQIMTYLIENETVALMVPARFLGQIHPHFREIMQLLAIQAADEARHIEVFTRRAGLKGHKLGISTVGGQASLKTLLEEPDFALAMFLLSVLGEGTFLSLLAYLHKYAPDKITARICRLAMQDEARHVAFGLAHLERHVKCDSTLLARLAGAIERRHSALQHTSGLNEEVFDALVLLGAGNYKPASIAEGYARVMELQNQMDLGRQQRLTRLGFTAEQSRDLSALHTRNFM